MLHRARWLMFFMMIAVTASAQSVTLDERDAEVWLRNQIVRGTISAAEGAGIDEGIVYVDEEEFSFQVAAGAFGVEVELVEGVNRIVACAGGACSDTLRWELGYALRPEVYAYADVSGREVELHGRILESPNGDVTTFEWRADAHNPAAVTVPVVSDSVISVRIPDGAPHGEYYFDLRIVDAAGRDGSGRTFVTVDDDGVEAFDIRNDHAAWIDRAMVYEVTPYIFEGNGKWRDVTDRLDEIAALGVNTLWIQPVVRTHGRGQGYDVTDYFQLRPDLGTEADLHELVRSAKDDYGMRVLFDFVPNHTSIHHPYALDVAQSGATSHYYNFYLTEPDAAAYSQHYNTDKEPFIYYFWEDLVILDWDNPEVYRWMMEAGRKWIEDFDIDGYRIDAVWGLDARTPDAMQKWRFDLKRMKPEVFLLGEDKATWPSSFDERFDAAYDWYPEEGWVSHWTWEVDFTGWGGGCREDVATIFNSARGSRSDRLRDALTNRGDGWHADAKVFRFLQNNDTFPFISSHGLERTKMAGVLLFALHGIPMIYNGQEIGHDCHPYATWQIFRPGSSMRDQDPYGLYEHYRELTALRSTFPVLYSDTYDEVPVTPDNIADETFAFRRWDGDAHALAIVNMGPESVSARLALPIAEMGLDESATYYLTDLFSGSSRALSGGSLRFPVEPVPGYTTRLYILADEAVQVPTGLQSPADALPDRVVLDPNYPNPFNPSTTITFEVTRAQRVTLRVYDVLGRDVATLVDATMEPGRHRVQFEGTGLASGVYFYQLRADGRTRSRRMVLAN